MGCGWWVPACEVQVQVEVRWLGLEEAWVMVGGEWSACGRSVAGLGCE